MGPQATWSRRRRRPHGWDRLRNRREATERKPEHSIPNQFGAISQPGWAAERSGKLLSLRQRGAFHEEQRLVYRIGFSFSHVVGLTGFLGLFFRGWLLDGTVWCLGIDVHYMRGYIICYTRLVVCSPRPIENLFC